jgi:hypothetical protein
MNNLIALFYLSIIIILAAMFGFYKERLDRKYEVLRNALNDRKKHIVELDIDKIPCKSCLEKDMCFKSDIFVCTKIRLYLVEKIKEKEGD